MPKRINRIRGILKPMIATRSWNDAAHEISSAESKRIIFCGAESYSVEAQSHAVETESHAVETESHAVEAEQLEARRPKKKAAGIPVPRRKANCSGLKMTKDRNAVEIRGFNRLKWLENHERSAVSVLKSAITL